MKINIKNKIIISVFLTCFSTTESFNIFQDPNITTKTLDSGGFLGTVGSAMGSIGKFEIPADKPQKQSENQGASGFRMPTYGIPNDWFGPQAPASNKSPEPSYAPQYPRPAQSPQPSYVPQAPQSLSKSNNVPQENITIQAPRLKPHGVTAAGGAMGILAGMKNAAGFPDNFRDATVRQVEKKTLQDAKSFWENISNFSNWFKQEEKFKWNDEGAWLKWLAWGVRAPFRAISNRPLETAILASALLSYYYYKSEQYKKAGQGLAKDIENGIAKGDRDRIGTDRAHIAAIIKRNKDFERDLKTLEANLSNQFILPARGN